MSTHVVNEFHARPRRGDDVVALLVELSPESRGRPGCEAISIRRNQDDPNNVIGDTRWTTRQHCDDYLAWRTQDPIHSPLQRDAQGADADPILRRDPIQPGARHARTRLSPSVPGPAQRAESGARGPAQQPEEQQPGASVDQSSTGGADANLVVHGRKRRRASVQDLLRLGFRCPGIQR